MPVRLQTPIGLPTSFDAEEEAAWSEFVATQLRDVRASAESWRNGLAAMLGAISVYSLVSGPEAIAGLAPWARYGFGSLLLLAAACATFGAWNALAAAYGWPSATTRAQVRELGGVTGHELKRALHAARRLAIARVATVVALAMLGGAIGLAWYGPTAAANVLTVEREGAPNACGRLVSSRDGQIRIEPASAPVVAIDLATVTRLRSAKAC